MLMGPGSSKAARKPSIIADAAHWILTQDSKETTGNFFIDEEVLLAAGVTDIESYSVEPGNALAPDFFI